MFTVDIDRNEDVAVLQCRGRIVRGEATYLLRDVVTSQRNARIVVLDLSAVDAVDGNGLGVLVFVHRWTRDQGVQLKLVNPSPLLREMLVRTRLTCVFDVSSVEEAVEILCGPVHADRMYATAS